MAIRNAYPVHFIPRGLTDANDQSNTFPGACKRLANLIVDAQNPDILVVRPGVTVLSDFSITAVPAPHGAWADPGVISVFLVVGTRIYGMISTSLTAGKDEPFCYDAATSAFVNLTGVTANNVPTTPSPSVSIKWTPPTMAMIGTKIIVTHPGFDGNAGPPARFFGVIDTAAMTWDCQNTVTNPLPSVPVFVAQYNNRAWYGVANATYYSNVLVPGTITNASQVLILGDASPVVAAAGLALGTSTQGTLAALIVFKGAAASTWQITGDAATLPNANLLLNQLSNTTGCWAPRSLVNTSEGLKFMGVDGMYVVNLLGQVIPLVNDGRNPTPDLQEPFINATEAQASHAAASYNEAVYRICLNTTVGGQPLTGDYWFEEHVRRWTGPHTFDYHCAAGFQDAHVLCSNTIPGVLFRSEVDQHPTSVFTDNGTVYSYNLISGLMPTQRDMAMHCITESMIEVGNAPVLSQYTITARDEQGNILGTATITLSATGPLWNGGLWNGLLWASGTYVSQIEDIPWTDPIIFQRLKIDVFGEAGAGIAIGTVSMRYQRLGYMNARVA